MEPTDERAIFAAIVAGLVAMTTADGTPVLDAVSFAESKDSVEASSDWSAYAVVWKIGSEHVDDAMSVQTPDVVCRTTFGLYLEVDGEESGDRADALSRLIALIMPAINDQSLAGMTLPGLTRLRQEKRTTGSEPDGSAVLTGEFTVLTADGLMDADFQT